MKFFLKIMALLSSLLFLVSGVSESVVSYTEGEPLNGVKQDYSFDDDRLLIGGYYGGEGLGKYAKEAYIDFVIESGVTEAELDEFYANGVGIIAGGYSLPRYYGNVKEEKMSDWYNIDLTKYKSHPALWGDDLIDEPSAECYDALQKAVTSYRKQFSDKICLINLFPIYANNEQLGENNNLNIFQKACLLATDHSSDSTVQYKMYVSDYINKIDTDYICVDIYPYNSEIVNGKEVKSTGEWWLRNLDILAEACRETGRKLWVITQAAGQTKNGERNEGKGSNRYCDEVSDISQQAFVSLAFGAKAIIHGEFGNKGWWDLESHMIGPDGKPTETYYAAQTVDGYMKAFAEEYGKYLYASTYILNKYKTAGINLGNLAVTVDEKKADITSKNGLVIGTFDGSDGSNAYIITNMEELNDNVTATANFNVPEGKTAVIWQKGVSETYSSGSDIILDPGEGVFITVK